MEVDISGTKIKIPKTFGTYKFLDVIGGGSFSVCCAAENIRTKQVIAAKVVSRQLVADKGMLAELEQELRILETIKHPGLCNIYQILYMEDLIIICMEYCSNGTLYEHVVHFGTFMNLEVINMFQPIVETVSFLHGKGIAHRDIKLDNIVLTDDYKPKLIDFGVSTAYRGPQLSDVPKTNLRNTVCGTLEYMSPEIIRAETYDPYAADIWALGVTLYGMVVGHFPFQGTTKQIVSGILSCQFEIPCTVHPSIQKVIRACLKLDPKERINAKELLKLINFSNSLKLPKLTKPQISLRKLSVIKPVSALWDTKKPMPIPIRVNKSARAII